MTHYHHSLYKKIFNYSLTLFLIFLTIVPCLIISFLIKISSKGKVFFTQVRVGEDRKKFTIYKFRTMKEGSEKQIIKYRSLNEADGPVFKIKNDPRFTKIGKILSKTGLDELPQLINVFKGEMNLVGPRPLPEYEFIKLTKQQQSRNVIKPGITSLWVICGSHNLSFKDWMKLDQKYINEGNIWVDFYIIFQTILILIRTTVSYIVHNIRKFLG